MFTLVWRLKGLTGSDAGHLELEGGRLSWTPLGDDDPGFDVPLAEVQDISYPWYYFSGGFKMRIGADKYRFSFVEPANDSADIFGGRRTGKEWKKALTGK
ncbi:MAG: hypothetical protein IPM59_14810 [Chloracidobacterium sp.]|nr:hypothetical protein [Chloracidobacterium sp.]